MIELLERKPSITGLFAWWLRLRLIGTAATLFARTLEFRFGRMMGWRFNRAETKGWKL